MGEPRISILASSRSRVGVDWILGASELECPVATDPAEIARALGGDGETRVVFCTYHSLGRVTAAQAEHGVPPVRPRHRGRGAPHHRRDHRRPKHQGPELGRPPGIPRRPSTVAVLSEKVNAVRMMHASDESVCSVGAHDEKVVRSACNPKSPLRACSGPRWDRLGPR